MSDRSRCRNGLSGCVMPDPYHSPGECHTPEMYEAQFENDEGPAPTTAPGHELISGCAACPFLSEWRGWKCTADDGPPLNDGVPDYIHEDCPHAGKVLAWPKMNQTPGIFPDGAARHVAYAVLAIDPERAEIKGVGIFSEPSPAVAPWATVVLFAFDADDYETAQGKAWAHLGAYPWIEKAFPVVHDHRHTRARERERVDPGLDGGLWP